jgi:uncharacterized phiE125 gp8 family phage protein
MSLTLITPATILPVSVADAKLACRFDNSALDGDIADMILDAARLTSHETGKSLTPETWELSLDAFPSAFELTRTPVLSIISVSYTDEAGVIQSLPNVSYSLDNKNQYGSAWVVPAFGLSWPAARQQINAVVVRYVAGYADAASVPSFLRRLVKIGVSQMIYDPAAIAGRLTAIDKIYYA